MGAPKLTATALSLLIPTGVIGISSALAVAQIRALENTANNGSGSVAERLSEIRQAVSATLHGEAGNTVTNEDGAKLLLAEWLNFGGGMGWHNGGWHNWGNGGWHNWGNGGWHNGGGWGNGGWHNGWHNFWHNW